MDNRISKKQTSAVSEPLHNLRSILWEEDRHLGVLSWDPGAIRGLISPQVMFRAAVLSHRKN